MDEESTHDSLQTPEKHGLDFLNVGKNSAEYSGSLNNGDSTDSSHHRASSGVYHTGDDSERNSTENLESANRKKVPHYLRASTGSCHDFCKYGRKHEFEEKTRTPLRIRIAKISPMEQKVVTKKNSHRLKPSLDIKFVQPKLKPSLDRIPLTSRKNASSGNKIPLTKHKTSPFKKNPSPDPPEVIKREILLPSRNSEVPIEHGSVSDGEMLTTEEKTFLRKKHSTVHLKPLKDKMKAPFDSSDRIPLTSRKNASSGNKIPLTKHKTSPFKKTPSPDPPEVIKREILLPSRNSEVPIEHGSFSDGEMLTTEEKTCLRKKHSTVHLKPLKDKMKAPFDSSDGMYGKLRRNSDVTPVKRVTEIKTSAQKAMAPPDSNKFSKISLSKTVSTESRKAGKLLPLPNDQNMIRRTNTKTLINEQVSGKTLHVIKTRSNAKTPSLSTHIKDVDGTTHKFAFDKNKLFKTGKAPSVTQNTNKALRKSRMIVSDDKRSPVKLKFKSGKVVDIQSDNNTPRRLKFRRARLNTTNVGISSLKVVLKHRDVQGKKDTRGLFNNVIEETASKLVESRKSKVKALVGAFETVISLQDSKPSAHTVKLSGD